MKLLLLMTAHMTDRLKWQKDIVSGFSLLKEHLGKGYVLRAGFAKAKGDIIVTIDSDGSHRPEELRSFGPVLARQSRLSYRLKIPKPETTWQQENSTLLAFESSTS